MIRFAITMGIVLSAVTVALAGDESDIVVMTQNQYLGTDFTAVVTATDPASFNTAIISALQSIAANNFSERVQVLARSIADREPDLVGLQEVFDIGCIDFGAGGCQLLGSAFNDHLGLTLDALTDHGADYYVAATVENVVIPSPGFPFPGLPVFLNADDLPDAFITVTDRDVILARFGVATVPVPFLCAKTSMDGCNYDNVAVADTLVGPISIERGFAGVDAVVKGAAYRFVNTHLEVQLPAPDPLAPAIQAAQASQLIGTLTAQPPPPGSRLIVVGDINSAPTHTAFPDPDVGPFHPPYEQFVKGTDLFGNPIADPYSDVWELRPGKARGFTCCELPDLSNRASTGDEQVDVIFAHPEPARVKANVLDEDYRKGRGLRTWPSDHFAVLGELTY